MTKEVSVLLLLAALVVATPVVEVCLPAAALGLSGHASHRLGAFWWNGTEWLPAPLYVEGKSIAIIYVTELNKTNPTTGRAMVLPPALEPNTKLCMYLPARNATKPPAKPPNLEGVYAEVQDKNGAKRHIFLATAIPAASPANLTKAEVNAKVIRYQRHVPANNSRGPGQQPAAGEVEPFYNNYYATTATLDYIGAFKLKQTDKYTVLCASGNAARGTIELPPNTYALEIVITAASTPTDKFGPYASYTIAIAERYSDGTIRSKLFAAVLPSKAPYATVYYVFTRGDAKTVDITIWLPPNALVDQCTFDAFVVVYGSAAGYWQRFHVVSHELSGTLSLNQPVTKSDGYYLVFPGYTVPPGVAYSTTYLTGSLTICGTSKNYIDIYWGTTYVTRVYGQSLNGCWTYSINTWIPPYENAKTGGSTHPILIGPIDSYTATISNAKLSIYGIYRPEMNRQTSFIWKEGVVNWLYMVYTSPFYKYRVEAKIYDRGGDSNTGSMRLAAYLSPYQDGALCPGNAIRIKLALNGGANRLTPSVIALYVQGDSIYDVVSLLLNWVSQLFGTMGKILEKIGTLIGWLLLSADTVKTLSGPSSASAYNDGNYLVVSVDIGAFEVNRPVILLLAFGVSLPQGGDYFINVKEVYMCDRLIYSDTMPIPPAQYYKPVNYINTYATQSVDIFRTFTCGKQEDLRGVSADYRCNVDRFR
ncbi:hypothetical protein [Pyrobaculum aerophilum]|uniref:P. aerophilum family 59 protein n=1 Tax=Pyrobaculum aerophilum TaxID=13773 RepID=A0A371QWK6_9CREN|nr:hypothetical protein [Pyrobaculum aerophilum]RFA94660.1 hypothetical protein CGL51_09345 [Pyrobaculum aerophilum]RFA95864.1 hypothetical protein CGL52_12100 [Pyrobaculum aerophilum]